MKDSRIEKYDVRLEPLKVEDFPVVRPWIDPGVFRIFTKPVDDEQLQRLLTKYEDGRPTSLGYRIVKIVDEKIVGLIHAVVNWHNDLAHVQQIIVDTELRNSGIGTSGLVQFLDICFDDVGVHRVQLFVDEDNPGAIACYEKAGFVDEGLMREAIKTEEGYKGWHCMSILEHEWDH